MKRTLDVQNWSRKDHFHFFKQFDEPFFGVVVDVDCTASYQSAKAAGHSFFLSYLHKTLAAANAVEPFRYRIDGDDVVVYDVIHASPTINRPDGTFGFSFMRYAADFTAFAEAAALEMARVRNSTGLDLSPKVEHEGILGDNVIHFSSLPWLKFTALSHARHFGYKESVPKISFGKMTESGGRCSMPVSVHVHHALVDGVHVAQFFDALSKLL